MKLLPGGRPAFGPPVLAPLQPALSLTLARTTQVPVDVLVRPTDATARTSQLEVDVLVRPTDATGRTSQLAVDVLLKVINPKERISQLPVDVLIKTQRDFVNVVWVDG